MLAEVESVAAAGIVAKALLQVFSLPVDIEEHKILMGASLGIAVFPDHGTDGPELWRRADVAMYRAKRAGGNRHVMLSTDITSAVAETVEIEAHMHSTLERQQFRLDYQPQYSMDGQIRGLEALLRVLDLNLDPISPDRFVPMAEENGLIHPLGKWALEEACRRLMAWNSLRPTPIGIAINLSPLQLMRADFPREVQEAITRSGINPAWLEMEISERIVLKLRKDSNANDAARGNGYPFRSGSLRHGLLILAAFASAAYLNSQDGPRFHPTAQRFHPQLFYCKSDHFNGSQLGYAGDCRRRRKRRSTKGSPGWPGCVRSLQLN